MGWRERLQNPRPLVIGHRGACGTHPENTGAGFEAAWQLGADAIEFDVRWSRDGEAVIIHDDTLDRTAGRPGRVGEMDWSELSTVDVGRLRGTEFEGQCLLRLDEVIERWASQRLLNIEWKDDVESLGQRWLARLANHPHRENLLVSSFNPSDLLAFHRDAPDVARGFLFETAMEDLHIEFARKTECVSLNGAFNAIDAASIRRVATAGFPMLLFTVNEAKDMVAALQRGARGLFTNFPARLRGLVESGDE